MKKILFIYIALTFTIQSISASNTVIDTVPMTQNFGHVSTTWDNFMTASPSDNIPLIKAPTPTKTGKASLSFPITLPEARGGLSPTLSIDYSSEERTTWLGNGWDISLSSFTLDTRWGVPRYNPNKESEIYLYNGQQMGPVFHRSAEYNREADRQFHLRQEQAFQRIIRRGNSPSNYYWEVTDKDGTNHIYGGDDNGFSTTKVLSKPDGNNTEWHISQTRDANNNYIKYQYQKVNNEGGSMIYPASITYNGHGNTEGNYKVEFILSSSRNDKEINCRTGMKRVMAHLLEEIIISYDGQRIRSYKMNYIEGAFEKTLLSSISEYDQNEELFYEYTFDYYDDVRVSGSYQPFAEKKDWTVPDDAVEFSSISGSIEGFNSGPTILGGAKSWSIGGGLAITVGPPFNPATKDNSVGPNGGYLNSTSTGLTALVDIDSDGLPDKVWKEDGKLYYRPNQHQVDNPISSFGIKREITGVTDFSKSNTSIWSVGVEVNLFAFFGGYTHEDATTNISTYFADFNGDDLIDIASDGKVYFNSFSSEGYPNFTTSSAATPSPIFAGEPLDPDLIVQDPNAQAELENQFPLHDVVRIWQAPYNGTISITAPVQLIVDPDATEYETEDGVTVMIQHENNELWRRVINEGDFSAITPNNVSNINVSKGDRIYFRVHSNFDGSFDEVQWNPTIDYLNENLNQTDANCLQEYSFNAADDFLVSNRANIILPREGTISIKGIFDKPILSDSITLSISAPINIDTTFAPSAIHNGELLFENITVNNEDKVNFAIQSKSNVDWANISWSPVIEYVTFADGSTTTDTEGNALVSLCPPVDYKAYEVIENIGEIFIAPSDGILQAEIILNNTLGFNDNYSLSIKTKNKPDSTVIHTSQFETVTDTLFVERSIELGDTLYVDFHYNNYSNLFFNIAQSSIVFEGDTLTNAIGIAYHQVNRNQNSGHLYRGWGQFVYNANGGLGALPIITGELSVDTSGVASDTLLIGEETSDEDLGGGNLDTDDRFIVMQSDPKSSAWRGSDASIFLTGNTLSSSRKGIKYPDASFSTTPGGSDFQAYNIITRLVSDGGAAGAQVGPGQLGGGLTGARSYSVFDITDLNGDRYPDYLTETSVQYTNMRGGMTNQNETHSDIFDTYAHYGTSLAIGGGVGGSYISSGPKNSGSTSGTGSNKISGKIKNKINKTLNKARSAFLTAKASIGISGNFTQDKDESEISFLDINGDGLEDKITSDGQVALNLGYEFAAPENWIFTDIRKGTAYDYGGGLGFSYSNNSIAGGISVSRTENNSTVGFMDINGDALLDQIISTDPYMVRINKGHSFATAVEWFDETAFDAGASIGESINGAGTLCLEFLFFRICFNPSVYTGQGSSGVHDAFVDIDGDGYTDFLTAYNNDVELHVQSSNIKRTNLLKTINGPLGSQTELDYVVAGNTRNIPFSRWVLSSAVMYDGLPGDGEDYFRKSFAYSEPYYDRHERQFYGFATIEENHLVDNLIARKIITEYDVDSYYTQGLRLGQKIYDADNRLFQSIENTYVLKDIETGTNLPPSFASRDDGVAYPSRTQSQTSYFEGQTDDVLTRTNIYEYDIHGNVLTEIDIDGAGYTRIMEIEYFEDIDKHLLNKQKSETIVVDAEIKRYTQFAIDDRGNQTQIKKQIDTQSYATTDLTFDTYGNVLSLHKPENHLGERMSFTNTYDALENQYLISEVDGYGYETQYSYEPLYNQLTSSIDLNNNTTLYSVDSKGRTETITYPYEVDAGLPYSIQFSYYPNATTPHAIAKHYDPEYGTDIILYQFEDGMHRNAQNKNQASLYSNGNQAQDGFIVSGTDKYDQLGRIEKSYLPTTEPINNGPTYSTDLDGVAPITTLYDLLDRPIHITEVDSGETQIIYSISPDDTGNTYFSIHTTDALKNSRSEYYNTRNEIVSQRFDSPDGDIWTHYTYDGLGQVLTITDPLDNITQYSYDMLGRRISVNVPDAGLTELRYDGANNLTERITATIRDVISTDGSIRYTYDKERLVQIDYPKYFQNKVQIHYGSVQDSFNRVGRIWLQEDGTGGREYFYDANGNPSKTIRTVMINRANVFTYVTENKFDTWGRVKSMKYADGEEVDYVYNEGGQLQSMIGNKGGVEYKYLDFAGYDKFVDRRILQYGNGTEDQYTFDNKGRLSLRELKSANNQILYREKYGYDLSNNVLSRKNTGQGSDLMGGTTDEIFTYDNLYRMSTASGQWNGDPIHTYDLIFDYDPLNNLTMKMQDHQVDNNQDPLTSLILDYEYLSPQQPTRPSEVGGKDYQYDPNGNLLLRNSVAAFDYDQNFYDEENRLMGHSNNGYRSHYTYDAFGRRTIKSHGEFQGIAINGAPAGFVEHKVNYKVAVSPYFAAYSNDYRKHYFIDDMRIATKIGTGVFQTSLGDGPELTAGGIDYKSRITQYENSLLDYYASLGVPPGPPTLLALLGQPEINTISLPDANADNPYNTPPSNWPSISPPDPNGPPGAPVFYSNAALTRENVTAGYNFTSGSITKEAEQFFYHYDHTESTQYVTDYNGEPRQYATYFPSGERWIHQKEGIDSTIFFFNGLELDSESDMYYMGEIYYDPVTNIEMSIDPILQNFGESTFLERPEGSLFYDYADTDRNGDTDFDPEILNAERPDITESNAINVAHIHYRKYPSTKQEIFEDEDLGFWSDHSPKDTKADRRKFSFSPNDPSTADMIQQVEDLIEWKDGLLFSDNAQQNSQASARRFRKFSKNALRRGKKERAAKAARKKRSGTRKVRIR